MRLYNILLVNYLITFALLFFMVVSNPLMGYAGEPAFIRTSGLLFVNSPGWSSKTPQCIAPQSGAYISSYDWCLTPSSNLVVVWGETRREPVDSDIHAQMFSPDGLPLWRIAVNRFRGCQQHPGVVALPDNSIFVVWQSDSAGTDNINIWCQRIFNNARPAWKTPVPVCTQAKNQVNPVIGLDPDGSIIIAWEDYRHDSIDIYGQRFEIDGSPVGPEDGVAIESGPGDQKDIQFVFDGRKNVSAISWHDFSGQQNLPVKVEVDIERVPIPEPCLPFLSVLLASLLYRRYRGRMQT